jgi:hypothetical protein
MAALATPAQNSSAGEGLSSPGRKSASPWSDDDLADDVATLSYESALRAHARYRSTDFADQSLTQAADPAPFHYEESFPAAAVATGQEAATPAADPEPEPDRLSATPFQRNLKDASITIRMSKAECAQLHRRAAEAGLTVSAYLRSCTLEAETLRAMVKETLAQLRPVTAQAKPVGLATPPRAGLGRLFGGLFVRLAHGLSRLLTPWNGGQRIARA